MKKDALRRKFLRLLRQQPAVLRLVKSRAIALKLRRLQFYRKAKTLLVTVAFDGEVETLGIIEQALADGKRVAVPALRKRSRRMTLVEIGLPKKDLVFKGPHGIPQPQVRRHRIMRPEKLDLILVPAVAFDRQGHRLGRGGGYFDRFLAQVPTEIPRVGLCFRFQLMKKLAVESHDQPVSKVITE